MSHKQIFELQEGAYIVSDVHYDTKRRPEFYTFLEAIDSGEIKVPQLILMGDIFDTLFGFIPATTQYNQKAVTLLQKIAHKVEVLYLEGNHDFQLQEVFENIRVVPMEKQPLISVYKDKKIALAHGDFYINASVSSLGYKIYCSVIRNRFVLKVLNKIDSLIDNKILRFISEHLDKKDDCNEFSNFREFIEKRGLQQYGCTLFIEGHFHQNKSFVFEDFTYINLGAFACNQRYFIVKSLNEAALLEEKRFSLRT